MARTTPWEDEYTLLCERCGYVIEGLRTEGDCPECAKPIAESLPDSRTRTAWQRRPTPASRMITNVRTLVRPLRTLDELRIDPESARRLLRGNLWLAAALFAPVCGLGVLLILERPSPLPGGGEMAWSAGSPEGAIALVGVFALVASPVIYLALDLLTWVERTGLVVFSKQKGTRVTRDTARTICAHGSAAWLVAALGGLMLFWALLPMGQDFGMRPPRFVWLVAGCIVMLAGFFGFELFTFLGLRRCRFVNRAKPPDSAQVASDPAGEP